MTRPLPALLYFSDVFAESSYSGALLIYRLLETYPPDRLFVIETSHARSAPARRLRGVTYAGVEAGNGRWATSRLHAWWSLWMTLRAASWAGQVPAPPRQLRAAGGAHRRARARVGRGGGLRGAAPIAAAPDRA